MYKKINLLRDPIWQLLRKVTIPASTGSLFQTFYNLVDTYFAGRISPEALAAIAKSWPIYFIAIAVAVGIGAGTRNDFLPSPKNFNYHHKQYALLGVKKDCHKAFCNQLQIHR